MPEFRGAVHVSELTRFARPYHSGRGGKLHDVTELPEPINALPGMPIGNRVQEVEGGVPTDELERIIAHVATLARPSCYYHQNTLDR